jgi:hypothetical protein
MDVATLTYTLGRSNQQLNTAMYVHSIYIQNTMNNTVPSLGLIPKVYHEVMHACMHSHDLERSALLHSVLLPLIPTLLLFTAILLLLCSDVGYVHCCCCACSYLIEPIRYRKVVVEILGPTAAAAVPDESDTIPLSPDQELRIHAEIDRFDKAMATIWQLRLEALEAIKKSCRRCNSEVDNMQNFLLVRVVRTFSTLKTSTINFMRSISVE